MASSYSQQIGFASGILVATQVGDIVPLRFGILQDATIEYKPETKRLFGQNRYAFALAQGKTEITIKAKFAGIRGLTYNKLLFGGTVAATETKFADSELQTIATTVTVTNAANFISDQGVFYGLTGLPLVAVATSPAVGEYSVSTAGVYTFNASDVVAGPPAATALISYLYKTAAGSLITFGNPAMGVQPFFSVVLSQGYDGRQQTWTFNRCVADRMMVPTKLDDFIINEFDIIASADPTGNLGTVSTDL